MAKGRKEYQHELDQIESSALEWFRKASDEVTAGHAQIVAQRSEDHSHWDLLSESVQAESRRLSSQITDFVGDLLPALASAHLTSAGERKQAKKDVRALLAAVHLRQWIDGSDSLAATLGGEGEYNTDINKAAEEFRASAASLRNAIGRLLPSRPAPEGTEAKPEGTRMEEYCPGTAFIMMQISDDIPELEDIKNTFKDVFRLYGITATRADEIEHSGVITERVLKEIRTSEFLVADLTGARPSVYYEIGYAHALRKNPILYRRKGEVLHFDLLVHNIPEYVNLADLRKKLKKRLADITGREIADN